MDYTALAAMVITGLLSIGGVSLFLKNNMPGIAKWVSLSKDAVETLSDVCDALKPNVNGKVELTADEIAKLQADVARFKIDLAAALGK